MAVPIKRSVAVVVRKDNLILTVRRPDDDDELPGIWGLPAGTFKDDETLQNLVRRIGEQKLGVQLTPIRKLAEGEQVRSAYRLQMELWEAAVTGTPNYARWQWADLDVLEPGRAQGSLCCELALTALRS